MISHDNKIHIDTCRCLGWTPVIAGAFVAVGFTFLLHLFSVAIGLTAYTTTSDGVETLAFGGLLGTCIGILASMFAAGWLAGYLGKSYCNKRHLGSLYGFLTWCVALVIAIFLTRHAHEYVSFYGHFISGTADAFLTNNGTSTNVVALANTQTNQLVISTYVLFSLFFLSAFASSLGGHCGMRHVCKNEMHD